MARVKAEARVCVGLMMCFGAGDVLEPTGEN